jgi:hypothetical protein
MRNNAMDEWLALRADYFEPVAREVVDHYLRAHGFGEGEADEAGYLTYRRGKVFLQFHYYVEDSPNFSPMVSIGLTRSDPLVPAFDRIGLWYAVPLDVEVRNYETWTFSSADDLRQVLTRVRDEVLDVYGRSLWENPDVLLTLIDNRFEEVKAERTSEIVNRNKQEAERAFRAHDYEKAARLYGLMKDSDLSQAERKRHEIAKKHSSQP